MPSGPGQQKKLVLFGWVCLHEHPPFWQFILSFFPFHAGVLRRTTPYVCNAFQWLWNLSTNLCLFLKFLRSVKKGPPSLNQARTELICYPAISLGLNSDILSILLVYGFSPARDECTEYWEQKCLLLEAPPHIVSLPLSLWGQKIHMWIMLPNKRHNFRGRFH